MLVSVAVPVPFLGELTYGVPEGMPVPPVGARVRVPLGTRTISGCVVAHDAPPREGETRLVHAVVDTEPFLSPDIVALCRWTADYYMSGLGDALQVAMPPGSRRGKSGFKTARLVAVTADGLGVLDIARAGGHGVRGERGLTPRQRDALEAVALVPEGVPAAALRASGVGADMVSRLLARGLVSVRVVETERDPFESSVAPEATIASDRVPTGEQRQALLALGALADARRFAVALLHGVTGSGKTEVYLRLAVQVVASGRQVLLMVPEIGLTPSVALLFRRTFGARVAIQHSALSDGERHDQWHRIRRGDVDVVIGTRSAVFAPLPRPGLVIVDEEHDTSYKQDETPRYHGRDVAIVRAQAADALVVLGSATPSMESYQNAATGKYRLLSLDRRALDRPLAAVRLVPMRDEYAERGPDVVVSRDLENAIDQRLAIGEQVMVLLNRRGYATSVFCRQCGDTFECPNCSVSLTMHTTRAGGRRLHRPHALSAASGEPPRVSGWGRCHYCNYSMRMPTECRACAAPYLEQTGFGTERVEAWLRERFPDARIGRVDRDSVGRKGALADVLGRFSRGEIDMLVGTQMIAKGHDFARVTLVGVISADVGLGLADFRASERTFQLLTQVAGRAGRGDRAGEAIIQTLYPEHYSVQLACAQSYREFFAREIDFRRSMHYPPTLAMVNVVARGRTFEEAMDAASAIAGRLRARPVEGLVVLGPAPAPMGRLRGEHRAQVFLKGGRRADMRRALQSALSEVPELRRRLTVDVDPLNLL